MARADPAVTDGQPGHLLHGCLLPAGVVGAEEPVNPQLDHHLPARHRGVSQPPLGGVTVARPPELPDITEVSVPQGDLHDHRSTAGKSRHLQQRHAASYRPDSRLHRARCGRETDRPRTGPRRRQGRGGKAAAARNGDNGTVKIHRSATPVTDRRNQPHVCVFYLDAFGFDPAQSVSWQIKSWPPTGAGGMAAVARYLADTSALARLRHRPVGLVQGPLIEAGLVATCGDRIRVGLGHPGRQGVRRTARRPGRRL